LAGVTLFK